MNLTPDFAPDAFSQWRDLDFDLQELVLDEMEKAADDPRIDPDGEVLSDLMHRHGGLRHYIFLRFVANLRSRKLTLVGLHHRITADTTN